MLLTVLPSKTSSSPPRTRRTASITAMDPLTRSLAPALHSQNPLTHLAEDLGTRLAADACVFIGRHLETTAITLTLWRAQRLPQVWQVHPALPTALEAEPLALSLMQADLLAQDPSWQEALRQLIEMGDEGTWLEEMRSHCPIPLNTTAETEGLILLMSQEDNPWFGLNDALAEELSCLVALAFHQHHLHQQARCSIDQLRYLNQLKDDFLSTLSHELRTPLTSMMLAIRMLRRPDLTLERKAMYLDILEQQCARETTLVNDLLMLQTLESNSAPVDLSPLNLNHFLRSLVVAEKDSFGNADLGLHLELPQRWITLETEPNYLNRVFQELLANARKYAEPGTVVSIRIENEAIEENAVTINLISEGASIQPEELPHIFDKFRRCQGSTQRAIPGTGTGLALVKGLMQQMQGQITVSSQPTARATVWQTCFTLCLPRYVSKSLATG